MTRSVLMALIACAEAICVATVVRAEITGETVVPDPARAWQLRDLSPVEAWLASVANEAEEHGDGADDESVLVLRARAWLARRGGAGDRALTHLDRAIELAPDLPDLRVDRAAFRSDRIEDSGPLKSLRIARDVRRDLEHALAVAPESADALAALAAFHLRAPGIAGGDRQEAAALLARLDEIAPSRRFFREAIELAEQERFAEAVERITLAISRANPPRPNWRVRMGDWLRRMGRDDQALTAYQQALAEAPQHAGAMYALGRMAAESGLAVDAGIDALQRFLELSRWPQDPEAELAWWHLGRIYAHAGCTVEAQTAFRRAITLDPGWREPRQSLERLADNANQNRSCSSGTEQPKPSQLPAG